MKVFPLWDDAPQRFFYKIVKYSLFFICILATTALAGQNISGKWKGEVKLPTTQLPLTVTFTKEGNAWAATIKNSLHRNIEVADSVRVTATKVYLAVRTLHISFSGKIRENSISGTFSQGKGRFPLTLRPLQEGEQEFFRPQTPRPPFNYTIKELAFFNTKQDNKLSGTFTTPTNKKDFPIAIIVSCSGSQDRDGTLFGHKLYWVIADHLTKNGIGVLRLDDRGLGKSELGKVNATTADFITDINSAVEYLTIQGFKNIGLVGHDEGAIIASILANQNHNVKFIVSLAGPALPIEELVQTRLDATLKSSNAPEVMIKASKAIVKEAYAFNNRYTGNNLQEDMESHLTEKFPAARILNRSIAAQMGSPWVSYFAKQTPQVAIEKLTIPVLALNGSKDTQINAEQNLAAWSTALQKAGNKNFRVINLPSLNHLFQTAKTGTIPEYGTIAETISPICLDTITEWIIANTSNL